MQPGDLVNKPGCISFNRASIVNFESIKKKTASQIVADRIMVQIQSKALAPGQKLPAEREMAEMLGVGRSSVREAVKALTVIGYLYVQQGKGTYVSLDTYSKEISVRHFMESLDVADINSLLETREVIECQVVALAAGRANAKHILQIGEAIIRMQQQDLSPNDFLNADREFHFALAVAADNIVLYEMVKLLIEQVQQHDENYITDSWDGRQKTIASANNLLMHIRRNDPKKAAEEMCRHLNIFPDRSCLPNNPFQLPTTGK